MQKKPNILTDAAELRRRAEARLRKQQQRKTARPETEADAHRLLHELQVHQVELEMQNAELQDARDKTEALLERYTDLYDFAPVGYLSIDAEGLIQEVNLTGAALLGVERSRLMRLRLERLVAPASRTIFRSFLKEVFTVPKDHYYEVQLLKRGGTFWAGFRAASAVSLRGAGKWCRVAFGDITDRKQAEESQRRMEAQVAANRELKQEITRRQAVEEALRKSEQYSHRLLAESLELQKQLRRLSRQILTVQEEERRRISRELHDEVAQILMGINLHLAALAQQGEVDAKGLKKKIKRTRQLVVRSLNTVHQFAVKLRPPALDDLGLIPALHSYMKEFAVQAGLVIRLTSFSRGRIEQLDGAKRTVLYRVAQEALTNIARHAEASLVKVSIRKLQSVICMEVQDNGKSFDVQGALPTRRKKGLGLLGMRERVEMVGGRFTVESSPGQGTTIRAEIPFANGTRD
jgi:PAS domain S-box-containing protein